MFGYVDLESARMTIRACRYPLVNHLPRRARVRDRDPAALA